MPESISAYCPFCRLHSQITPAYLDLSKYTGLPPNLRPLPAACFERNGREWWIGICNNAECKKRVLVSLDGMMYPTKAPSPSNEHIPEHVRRDLDEAKRCVTVSAWRACLTMARRAMQAACLLKGADENKKLYEQIDQLAANGVITKDLKDWAHEVRHLGNDGAHPPKDYSKDVVTKDDAADALELAESFLEVVFVTPALAAERRAKRTSTP